VIALSDEFRGLAEQVQKMNKHLEEQSEKFVTLNAHIEQQSKKFTTLKNRVAGYKTEIETLGKNYDAAQVAVGQLNKTNTSLLASFTDSADKTAKILETLNERSEKEIEARQKLEEKFTKDQIEMQQKLQVSIDAVTTAMQNQAQTQNPQDAEEMIRKEKERVEAFKKLQEEYGKFVKKEIEANENLDTRSRILGVAIAKYKKETGDRKLPFFEGMSLYLEEGGTRAEYLAQFLTSTREELKVFGVEVASVRKFMYGFLPPGTFRLVNKFASTLNFIGGTMRTLKADAEGTGNILTTTLFSGTIDKKGLRRLTEKEEELTGQIGQTETEFKKQLNLSTDASISQLDRDAAKEQAEYLEGILDELKEEKKGVQQKLKKRGNILARQLEKGFGISKPILNLQYYAEKGLEFNEKMTQGYEKFIEKQDEIIKNANNTYTKGQQFRARIKKIAVQVSRFLLMASMYILLFSFLFIFIKKFFEANSERIKEFYGIVSGIFEWLLGTVVSGVIDTISGISAVISGLLKGDVGKVFEGVLQIVIGVGKVLIGVAGTLFAGALSVIGALVYSLGVGFLEWSKGILEGKGFKMLGDIVALIIAAKALLFIISLLPVSLPFILVAALGVVIFAAVRKIISVIPGMAEGGVSAGGLTIVGERGPELVNLPKGSRVHSNTDSRKMTGSTVNNFNITINAKDSSKAEMRRMADEIGRMISSKINRSTSSSTLR
tara:strand:- start:146 stop:2305 length:2160 start_codon:yes stop_codon:yes gene_type:complete